MTDQLGLLTMMPRKKMGGTTTGTRFQGAGLVIKTVRGRVRSRSQGSLRRGLPWTRNLWGADEHERKLGEGEGEGEKEGNRRRRLT